jgi:uncharacterized protein YjaZ
METESKHLAVAKVQIGSYKSIIVYGKELQGTLPFVKQGLLKASRLLTTFSDIVIEVTSTDKKFIRDEMGGVSGETSNGHSINLAVNMDSKTWKTALIGTIAHEYTHAIRDQVGPEKEGLAEDIASEGIAQCFEEDVIGVLRPWSQAISTTQAKEIFTTLIGRLDERNHNLYYRLFLSKDDKEFPHWAGYTISYLLLKDKLTKSYRRDWNQIIKKRPEHLFNIHWGD